LDNWRQLQQRYTMTNHLYQDDVNAVRYLYWPWAY
jgi:hypothetical protein